MARTSGAQTAFATVRAEGGLLPPDLVARIAANDPTLKGLAPEDYGLAKGDKLNEAASRARSGAPNRRRTSTSRLIARAFLTSRFTSTPR